MRGEATRDLLSRLSILAHLAYGQHQATHTLAGQPTMPKPIPDGPPQPLNQYIAADTGIEMAAWTKKTSTGQFLHLLNERNNRSSSYGPTSTASKFVGQLQRSRVSLIQLRPATLPMSSVHLAAVLPTILYPVLGRHSITRRSISKTQLNYSLTNFCSLRNLTSVATRALRNSSFTFNGNFRCTLLSSRGVIPLGTGRVKNGILRTQDTSSLRVTADRQYRRTYSKKKNYI